MENVMAEEYQHIEKEKENGCSYRCGYSTIYVSSRYGRRENGEFTNIGFSDDVLEESDPRGLGIVLSGTSWKGIDHAPDAAHILFGLDLVPDSIDTVLALDRRGTEDFAARLLEPLISGGASIIWDGLGNLEAIIGTGLLTVHVEPAGYTRQIRYNGTIDEDIASEYARALLCCAADRCRVEYELQSTASSISSGYADIKCSWEVARNAVKVLSAGQLSFPKGRMNPWSRQVVEVLDCHRAELLGRFECVEEAWQLSDILCRIAEVWKNIPLVAPLEGKRKRNGRYGDKSIMSAAYNRGVDCMTAAVLDGIAVEDIVP